MAFFVEQLIASILLLILCTACVSDKESHRRHQKAPHLGDTDLGGPLVSSCVEASPFICEIESLIVQMMNEKRTSPLTQVFETSYVARAWSSDQLAMQTISHKGFPEARTLILEDKFPHLNIRFKAENVGMTMTSSQAHAEGVAAEFFNMWWQSRGHRENMMAHYRYVGVGVAFDGQRTFYATQIFH